MLSLCSISFHSSNDGTGPTSISFDSEDPAPGNNTGERDTSSCMSDLMSLNSFPLEGPIRPLLDNNANQRDDAIHQPCVTGLAEAYFSAKKQNASDAPQAPTNPARSQPVLQAHAL